MTSCNSTAEPRSTHDGSGSASQRLLKALRVLLSDEEIRVLVEYARGQHQADSAKNIESEADSLPARLTRNLP